MYKFELDDISVVLYPQKESEILMPTNLYLIRKQQLASVFEDTMAQIKQSEEWMIAIDYSIHNQQFIPESAIMSISNVPKADKPANIIVSRLRSFEAAAQYIGKRTADDYAGTIACDGPCGMLAAGA